ncbi:MAG: pentapeptide repeat-containing protein [Verrucomicrobia bacterium]|nr:pentapeptide repeat-containing protein [Verrucomicrobiota bacterium]
MHGCDLRRSVFKNCQFFQTTFEGADLSRRSIHRLPLQLRVDEGRHT